jgi:phosphoenolpyruvate---glycerone phosphotransferase subunit DhaM
MSGSGGPVGIVVVSHSAAVAAGVVEMAAQMAGPRVRIVAAGGAADGSLGTDATRIAAAMAAADAGSGVVVLADLGSAVIASRLAVEMSPPDTAARVRISRGPIVEGAVVAAVQAAAGDPLEVVVKAADDAAAMRKVVD